MFVFIELCQQTQERRRVSWWEEGNEGREKKGREERRKMKFREKEKKDRKIERQKGKKKEKNLFTQFNFFEVCCASVLCNHCFFPNQMM